MKNNNENLLDQFLFGNTNKKRNDNKKVILNQKEGLIERVDKIFVTKEGKQLLREQY